MINDVQRHGRTPEGTAWAERVVVRYSEAIMPYIRRKVGELTGPTT